MRQVALAVLEPRFHAEFVDLNWALNVWPRRVQRSQEVVDVPVDRLVGNVNLYV